MALELCSRDLRVLVNGDKLVSWQLYKLMRLRVVA